MGDRDTEAFFDSLREQHARTEESVRRLEGLIRSEAVRRVDARHGFTYEFSNQPSCHLQEYDDEERKLRKEVGAPWLTA